MALAMSAIKAKNFEMLIRSEGEWNCERRSHGSFITILPFSMYNNDIYSNDLAEGIEIWIANHLKMRRMALLP